MRPRSLAALAAVTTLSLYAASADAAPPAVRTGAPAIEVTRLVASARPWLYTGRVKLAASTSAELSVRGRAALATFAGKEIGALELVSTGVDHFGDGEKIVRFGQTHRGLPVVGAGAAVRFDATGDAVMATLGLADKLPGSVSPTFPAGEAAALASRYSPMPASSSDAKLVVHVSRGESRLAWAVLPRVPASMGVVPRIMVDAVTGHVIEVRDLALHAGAGAAMMYASNPAKSPTLASLAFKMAPTAAGGVLANDFLISANCAGDGVVKDVNFGFPLKARFCELEQGAVATSAGQWDYTPIDDYATKPSETSSDKFSEVSMYYHATRIYDFFRTLQGDPNAQIVAEKPFRTISNLRIDSGFGAAFSTGNFGGLPGEKLIPFSNAFYSPSGGGLGDVFAQVYGFTEGAMWFFQGPRRDYAYDGDVVYHEFVHAVINHTAQLGAWTLDEFGASAAPGAMNEGLADYFSSALTGDPDVGEYASQDVGTQKVIRTLDNKDTCDNSIVGEVHFDSTLFSGALWDARVALASEADRASLDKAVYKALRGNPGSVDVGYLDMAKLILAVLKTDFPAGETAVTAAMTKRGVLPACTRIHTWSGSPLVSPMAAQNFGFVAPGTQTVGATGVAPGIIQIKTELKPDTSKLTVSFASPKAQGGGGNPFGGGGTPFTPVVLVKFADKITWTTAGKPKHDADVAVDAVAETGGYTADIEVPAGSTVAAIQIGNKGQGDGQYDKVTIATEQTAPVAAPGNTPPATTEPTPEPKSGGGCGCSVPAQRAPLSGLAAAALGALALVRRRRRD